MHSVTGVAEYSGSWFLTFKLKASCFGPHGLMMPGCVGCQCERCNPGWNAPACRWLFAPSHAGASRPYHQALTALVRGSFGSHAGGALAILPNPA